MCPYLYQKLPEGFIRLLTLQPTGDASPKLSCTLHSTPLESAPEFEAISYAWGTEGFTDTLTVFNSNEPTPDRTCHSSISISPNVTCLLQFLRRADEPRVLWIDAICINQMDILERSVQVQQMRQIYTCAQRIVIWLGSATEDGSSDRAFSFLKTMAMHKKYYDRNHWVNGERVGSDTSSECGQGALGGIYNDGLDDDDEVAECGRVEGDGEVAQYEVFTEDGTEVSIHSSQARSFLYEEGTDTSAQLERVEHTESYKLRMVRQWNSFRLWLMYKKWHIQRHIREEFNYYIVLGYWNPNKRRRRIRKIEQAMKAREKERVGHIVFGFPVLYENSMGEFFHERFHKEWAAVDQLLYRSWWSRTWVVQEVWSASSRAILQCGQQTIKWKTFQKAMSYEDAWDDMGHMMKQTRDSRIGLWGQLERRYGLAIHLCKMRLIDGKLSDLLWNTWDREARDPRDKVFAILGLVSNSEGLLKPDYAKTTRRVFCEAARDIIRTEDSLDILLAAGGPRLDCDGDTLPSWVPDWRKEANEGRPVLFVNREHVLSPYFSNSMDMMITNGHGFSASADEKPVAWFGNDLATLHAHAVPIGEVGPVGEPQGTGPVAAGPIIDDACAVARAVSADGYAPWWKMTHRQDELRGMVSRVLCAGSPGEKTESDIIENVMPLRRFFITKIEKHMCIGPSSSREGDKIFIVAGCNFPIILRETAARPGADDAVVNFELVGEAYVHGIMAGEALEKIKAINWWERLAWWRPPKRVKWSETIIR